MEHAALLDQGAALYAAGRLDEAAGIYRRLLAHNPCDAQVLSNLGAVLNVVQDHAGAEKACRDALKAQPGYWAALANLGTALHRQQRFDEAVAVYLAAVKAQPANASAWTNLGVALHEQGRVADSLPMHDAAVALAPNDPEAHTNRAMALLMGGELQRGFAEFEWRWRTKTMAQFAVPGPQWLGELADDKTIFVYEEGGFGDTLQFVRYVPMLAEKCAQLYLRVQRPLVTLLQRQMSANVTLFAQDQAVPPFHLQCPIMSLPRGFKTTLHTVPAAVPYLTAPSAKAALWAERLQNIAGGKLRVGLVWAGAPRFGMAQMRAMDARRSLTLAQLSPLGRLPDIQFISLQLGGAEAIAACPSLNIFDPMAEMEDFNDTAALVANLDLVIAVDTAVAHLAGALGRPVWVLSRHDACWRWLAGRSDSPWYPSMKLYRQPSPGAWQRLLQDVARDLRRFTREARQKNALAL